MRTSRVSRDTARIVNALSPLPGDSVRRSLRTFARASRADDGQTELNGDSSAQHVPPTAQHASRKRKRESAEDPLKSVKLEETVIRRSPRKDPTANGNGTQRKARRQLAKHIKGPNGALTIEPPPNWEQVYNVTAEMRKRVLAPVDTMGCEDLAETHRSPIDRRLQTLIALMLSSQTKDTVTAVAIRRMQEQLPGGFNLAALLAVESEELNRLIEKVGFHNNKTRFIKAVAVILRDQFGGDIPDTIEGLVSLPGVGPKMAYLCMSAAWGRDEGIGVDVHVHRITNLWGWHKTSTPEQTRAELEAWLPKDKWHAINHLLVGFGQTICLPIGRKCGECDLAAQGLCPSAQVTKSPVKKRIKKEVELDIETGAVVKEEELVVQSDDVGIKVEADTTDDGKIEMTAMALNKPA